ncbi:ATP-binding protein [Mycobacterium sp. CVI_P3]|uniref:histidine kinase n=1 Tax=Mycobacterium pinniadriaticum TaxID=2994102 RepID=A0ABT3SMN4_9MYCO|nr:ATP-binding protein [Mycobacterium pinniadriaticum]MCX2934346.1 ATP-binding protein [Mycobacterium pinniadriaticum]MCX2940769.1 ATP-binding protein [Mycobacterium pinniadriaticum]
MSNLPAPLARAADFLGTEPVRVAAVLRLPLIVLIALLVYVEGVDHWLPAVYWTVLIVYTATAAVWLAVVLRSPLRWWFGWASTAIDVVAVLAMCVASGGATSWLLPIFFLIPITVSFLDRPEITALIGACTAIGYLAAWIFYSKRDDTMGLPDIVYVQVGCLAWLALATTALCLVLARRRARVRALLEVRRRLVSESMQADERNNRQLSEQLHDGPLQNLLAARLDLEDLREQPTATGFDRVDVALQDAITQLRSAVSTLHPQVLAQVGLGAALRELVGQYERRWDVNVDCAVAEVGKPASQALLYRAARELLANAHKHSRATRLRVELDHAPGVLVLRVIDNGLGFDPAILNRKVAEGHIGLSSLLVGVEAMGGSVQLVDTPGGGTTVVVTVPDSDVAAERD